MTIATLNVKLGITGEGEVKAGLNAVKSGLGAVDTAAAATTLHIGRLEGAFGVLHRATEQIGRVSLGLAAAGLVGASAGVLALGRAASGVGVEIDSLYRGLATVSDNADDMTAKLARMRDVAKMPGLGFGEAIQGAIRLQSVGLGFDLAARSMEHFGNAIASVGGGKEQLDGVTLALTQIVAKGKVSAEEINQLQERVPQIRRAMLQAFGTADTEVLQGRGIGAETFIGRIVDQLAQLPRMSGGARNAIENFGDSVKRAMEPLGRGLVMGLEAGAPAIDKLVAKFERLNTFLGEGIAAVVSSGALTETLDRLADRVSAIFGEEPKRAFADFAATVLVFFERLPSMASEVGEYLKRLFASIGDHLMQIPRQLGALSGIDPKTGKAYTDPLFSLDPRNPLFPRLARQMTDAFNPRAVDNYPVWQGFGNATMGMDARIKGVSDNIFNTWTDVPSMPGGLLFGGNPSMIGGDGEGGPKSDLKEIARNTRETADILSLRRQTLGGGDLAALGVTGAEIASQRRVNGERAMARYRAGQAWRDQMPTRGIEGAVSQLLMNILRTEGVTIMGRA